MHYNKINKKYDFTKKKIDEGADYFVVLQWFKKYLMQFRGNGNTFSAPILMKILHSYRVVCEIKNIAHTISGPISLDLAQCTALLHDIGRFQQYAVFGGYDDRNSIDHAALGVMIIDQAKQLSVVSDCKMLLIKSAIFVHNKERVDNTLNDGELLLAKMLRDADKLDIYSVIIAEETNQPIAYDYTGKNLESLRLFQRIPYSEALTTADIRLFRISWLFDINFKATIRAIFERLYIERLFSKLPQTQKFEELQLAIKDHLMRRLEQ